MKKTLFSLLLISLLVACGPIKKETQKERILPEVVEIFSGSRGSICWGLCVKQVEGKDVFLVRGIETLNNKLAFEFEAGSRQDANAYIDPKANSKSRRVVSGDRVWTLLPGGKLEARNIYTGEVLENHQRLQQKFPELKEGINFWSDAGDMPGFIAEEKTGKTYWFDMENSLMVLVSAIPANLDFVFPKKEYRTLFVKQDGSVFIYVEKQRANEVKGYRAIALGTKFSELPDHKNDSIQEIKVESKDVFYNASVLAHGSLFSIVSYSTSEKDRQHPKLASLSNANGSVLWNTEDEFSDKKNWPNSYSTGEYKCSLFDKEFVMMQRRSPREATGLDATNGKRLWQCSVDSLFTNFKE